jgi:hypothetical protein
MGVVVVVRGQGSAWQGHIVLLPGCAAMQSVMMPVSHMTRQQWPCGGVACCSMCANLAALQDVQGHAGTWRQSCSAAAGLTLGCLCTSCSAACLAGAWRAKPWWLSGAEQPEGQEGRGEVGGQRAAMFLWSSAACLGWCKELETVLLVLQAWPGHVADACRC